MGSGQESAGSETDGSTGGDAETSAEEAESGDTGQREFDDDGRDDDSVKFDLFDADAPLLGSVPCGVDILFVIDNSGSMAKHKDDIVAAFATFVDEMVATLEPSTLVHVGVTRATGFYDPGNGSGWNDPTCEFGFLDGTWNPPTLANNGINGQQGRLFETQGQRYFEFAIGQDSAALGQWFEATVSDAVQLDASSNTESVVAAAAYPFAPVNATYNVGFLREQAVLVLFLLSDAPDATPIEIPTSDLIALVSEAKFGCGDGCVLPTGIVQAACYDQPGNLNERLFEFMHGFGGPPAAVDFFDMNQAPASFASVFGSTLAETIAYTCENIVPEG